MVVEMSEGLAKVNSASACKNLMEIIGSIYAKVCISVTSNFIVNFLRY